MSATIFYNSQPVDDYIKELSLREREVTRSRGIDNYKKEVPYKILLFLGYVVGVCLLILCIFYGLKNLLTKYGVVQEVPYAESNTYEPQSMDEDRLIDIERFLPNSSEIDEPSSEVERPIRNSDSQGSGSENDFNPGGSSAVQSESEIMPEENPTTIEEPRRAAVRDYVIFDTSVFDGEYISEVVVGRRYEDQESEANSQWCYTELSYASGLVKTLYLIVTNENGVLEPIEITHEIANKFGVPISEIHRAQRTCSI